MNRGVILAILAFFAYCFVSVYFYDYSIPVYSLPIIGTVYAVKPFEMLAPYTIIIGLCLAGIVTFVTQKRGGKR
jgi:hypothetical protein